MLRALGGSSARNQGSCGGWFILDGSGCVGGSVGDQDASLSLQQATTRPKTKSPSPPQHGALPSTQAARRAATRAHLFDLSGGDPGLWFRVQQPLQQVEAGGGQRQPGRDVQLLRLHLLEHQEDALF